MQIDYTADFLLFQQHAVVFKMQVYNIEEHGVGQRFIEKNQIIYFI